MLTWIPWLESLGVMAVVFAVGIAIGFGLSALLRRREPRRPARPKAPPRPIAVPVTARPAERQAVAEPPPQEPVVMATPDPAPVAAPPPEPSFQTMPEFKLSATLRYPANSFGRVSLTRPDSDYSSSGYSPS